MGSKWLESLHRIVMGCVSRRDNVASQRFQEVGIGTRARRADSFARLTCLLNFFLAKGRLCGQTVRFYLNSES
jgi:hypothetical protein